PRESRNADPTQARRVGVLDDGSVNLEDVLTTYERLLCGVAASESLSRRGCLCHRRGIHHSNWFCGFSGVGIAELDAASCRRTFVSRFSGRAYPRMGVRRDAARNSSHPEDSWWASAPQYHPPRRRRGDNFYSCRIFSLATRLGTQDRQIGGGVAL